MPAGTAEERAADAAADALIAGRPVTFGRRPGGGAGAGTGRRPVLQRYMAWEHSMLGDLDPAQVQAAADGDAGPVADYRDLLGGARAGAAAGGRGTAARRAPGA